jgi:cell filamentation protein
MYDATDDPYCYPGTTVLKNVAGILDQAALDEFETAIVAQRSDEPLPRGRFSQHHYCAVHRHLFQDVYHWAGRFRTVRISKGGSTFCYPENIPAQIRKLFQELRQQRALQGLTRSEFLAARLTFLVS